MIGLRTAGRGTPSRRLAAKQPAGGGAPDRENRNAELFYSLLAGKRERADAATSGEGLDPRATMASRPGGRAPSHAREKKRAERGTMPSDTTCSLEIPDTQGLTVTNRARVFRLAGLGGLRRIRTF